MSAIPFTWKGYKDPERTVGRTLSQLFEAPLPSIILLEGTSDGTGWNDDFATVDYENVKEWEDFDCQNIDEILNGLGDESIPWTVRDEMSLQCSRDTSYKIKSENDIDTMISKTMEDVICATANHICPRIRRKLNMPAVKLEMKHEGVGIKIERQIEQVKGAKGTLQRNQHKRPDWPIYEQHTGTIRGGVPAQVYVAGDSKRHYVFDPLWLKDKDTYKSGKKAYVAIGQVGMYCYYGKTRYGFIVTSTTLTALRYNFISTTAKALKLGVEYKIIPLEVSGPGLTAVKAIVSLTALSMHDYHREVVPEKEVMPLNAWYRHQAHNTEVFVHLITERIERSLPSSAQTVSNPIALKYISPACYREMEIMARTPPRVARAGSLRHGVQADTTQEVKKSESRENTLHEVREFGKTKVKVKKPKNQKLGINMLSSILTAGEALLSPQATNPVFYYRSHAASEPRHEYYGWRNNEVRTAFDAASDADDELSTIGYESTAYGGTSDSGDLV